MAESSAEAKVKTVDEWAADATALIEAGRLEEAEALLARLMQAKPDYHPAFYHAAILSWRAGRLEQAHSRFAAALALAPDAALYHRNACEVLRRMQRLDEALVHGLRRVELAPDDADAYYNLAIVYYDRVEIPQAIAAIRKTLQLQPNNPAAHFELSEALLLSGQFEEGWREYEWRLRMPGAPQLMPPTDRPQWDGKPMPGGTLMLIGDQGFGDTIQFSRYIAQAARLCPNIVMASSAKTRPIVMQQKGISHWSDRWENIPPFDAYCPLSGLARLFHTDLSNISGAPYLKADPAKAARGRARLEALTPSGYRRIGLVWAGRPEHGNDFNRSCSLQKLAPLMALENIVFVSMQLGPAQKEIDHYRGPAPLIDLGAENEDFADSMGIFEALDRLVTVDTAAAHLAGAMGRPVSVLLPYAPDWRWLLGRSDSPWYEFATLHRQDRPGDWNSAIRKMIESIKSEAIV